MKNRLQLSSDNGGTLGDAALVAVNIATPGGGGGPTVLLKDTFTDANGTNLASHTMDVGAGWTLNGTWTIQGNQAQAGTVNDYSAWADSGQTNVTITASLTPMYTSPSDYATAGLIARVSDANNFWLAILDPNAQTLFLYQKASGTFTQVASTSFTSTNDTPYNATLQVSGSTVTFTVNTTTVSYANMNTNLTATNCGIRQGGNGAAGGIIR